MNLDVVSLPAPCAFMAALIDLLGEMPTGCDHGRSAAFRGRLDRLEDDALRNEAPETTMAAIKGARVLQALAELPPPRHGTPLGPA